MKQMARMRTAREHLLAPQTPPAQVAMHRGAHPRQRLRAVSPAGGAGRESLVAADAHR
ncbi:MAG TPA: hypothetical protein VF904_03570 [Anaeromyxobacteraceae bacterium]